MFIGHFAVGFAAKKLKPSISLGTYFLSCQLLDLLWPTFLLLDIEHVKIDPGITEVVPLNFIDYPLSHSLITAIGWGILFGLVYWLIVKDKKGAILLGAGVVSHWVLDFFAHRPDLPLAPGGSSYVGLGLWNSFPATLIVEFTLFAIGVIIYAKSTKPKDRQGTIAFWSLVIFLLVIHVGNLFGPPPPNVEAIAWVGELQWLIVLWGYWIDKHRLAVSSAE